MANLILFGGSGGSSGIDYDIVYYNYVNTSRVVVGTISQKIYRQSFDVLSTTNVNLWFECKILSNFTDDWQTLTFEYYLDDVKFDYQPQHTYDVPGYHTPNHMYNLVNLEPGFHYWEVRLSVSSGTATISIGDLHAQVYGQHLNDSPGFDGEININESFTPFIGGMDIVGLSENVSIAISRPKIVTVSDAFTPFIGGMDIIGLSDNMNITREKEQYYLVTEDGDNLATEDGDLFIT
jgi:hypothetical protein